MVAWLIMKELRWMSIKCNFPTIWCVSNSHPQLKHFSLSIFAICFQKNQVFHSKCVYAPFIVPDFSSTSLSKIWLAKQSDVPSLWSIFKPPLWNRLISLNEVWLAKWNCLVASRFKQTFVILLMFFFAISRLAKFFFLLPRCFLLQVKLACLASVWFSPRETCFTKRSL